MGFFPALVTEISELWVESTSLEYHGAVRSSLFGKRRSKVGEFLRNVHGRQVGDGNGHRRKRVFLSVGKTKHRRYGEGTGEKIVTELELVCQPGSAVQ